MSELTNKQRKTRTEGRISELRAYLSKSKYRHEVIANFTKVWGVGETTIAHVVQDALRMGKIDYSGGKYYAR